MLTGLGQSPTPGDSAVVTDLELFAGADKLLDLQIFQPDLVTPQDITAWALVWTAHTLGDPLAVWLVKDDLTNGGLTITDPAHGWCQITVAAADTLGWAAPATLAWRAERTDAGADAVVARGLLVVYPRGP